MKNSWVFKKINDCILDTPKESASTAKQTEARGKTSARFCGLYARFCMSAALDAKL